ncbi:MULTISPECIES: hypothetical protein [Moorena]|uniref:hypothetical protein n=1 Tax=Moorena TaxID=1155738 RepID=UPI0013764365|nr:MULTISPECIES: hypothetical protein [Moorena]NEP68951.1 hypothetical protein [Moorena sp. SIO3A5]NER88509.1 hypothetical protein [Moorena sp. SIO3A2]NES46555.1 hypothetical protein [Moorena sp. SIO2C4]
MPTRQNAIALSSICGWWALLWLIRAGSGVGNRQCPPYKMCTHCFQPSLEWRQDNLKAPGILINADVEDRWKMLLRKTLVFELL